jgi:DNA-binding transcriptional regulator YiaG
MFTYNTNMKQWTPEKIRELRKRLNIYQKDFAALIGVTREYVILLEKGVRMPSKTLRLLLDCIERENEEERG